MKDNKRNRSERTEERVENESLRNPTTNETIREVSQDRSESDNEREGSSGRGNVSTGRSQRPSRETMHGTADMSHDQEMGKGRDIRRQSSGQNLAPKLGVTGSDFDGQNAI